MSAFDGNRLRRISPTAGSRQRFALWYGLLETAIQTPSSHNAQPWRIRLVSEREAELYIDGERTLPKEDTTGSFILSAMGMFVEAVALLAAPQGFDLVYQLSHPAEWYGGTIIHERKTGLLPFANLQLSPCSPRESPYPDALFLKRRTSRIGLLPTPVGEAAFASLADLATQWGQRYDQITHAAKIENILAQNTNALFEDLNTPSYHDEIVAWFCFTDRAAKRHRDGLDWRCMNTSRTAFWMSLVEMGILKSIGPDQKKLENKLELFGPKYRYLIFGYPPFIRAFVDETRLKDSSNGLPGGRRLGD